MGTNKIDSEISKKLFYEILRIRKAEEEIARRYGEQEMRCPVHLSVGQEATPVGMLSALNLEDHSVSSHRGHAHYLAKGGSLNKLICELYGKVGGCSRGQGGSMHLIDLDVNFTAATSIVAGTVPVGVGIAFKQKMKKEKNLTVVFIGDTVMEEGVFHESMNFAALHKLPVIFCCENNFYSCFSPIKNRQPERPITDIAKAHGMRVFEADGNNVFDVYQLTQDVQDSIREGEGPIFAEFKTYRQLEHCGPGNDDNLNYRDEAELAKWLSRDPIEIARNKLKAENIWTEQWESEITKQINGEVEAAFEFAKESPFPAREELGAYTYAP